MLTEFVATGSPLLYFPQVVSPIFCVTCVQYKLPHCSLHISYYCHRPRGDKS